MEKMVIFAFAFSFIILSCKNGEEEIIIVPRDYTGYLVIIYNQKAGTAAKYEGKKRIYEIPQNGILKTQFAGNNGWRSFPEYYYEKIDYKNRISSFAEFDKIPAAQIVGLMGAGGTVRKGSATEERVEFAEFYIGTKSQIEEARKKVQKLDILQLAE